MSNSTSQSSSERPLTRSQTRLLGLSVHEENSLPIPTIPEPNRPDEQSTMPNRPSAWAKPHDKDSESKNADATNKANTSTTTRGNMPRLFAPPSTDEPEEIPQQKATPLSSKQNRPMSKSVHDNDSEPENADATKKANTSTTTRGNMPRLFAPPPSTDEPENIPQQKATPRSSKQNRPMSKSVPSPPVTRAASKESKASSKKDVNRPMLRSVTAPDRYGASKPSEGTKPPALKPTDRPTTGSVVLPSGSEPLKLSQEARTQDKNGGTRLLSSTSAPSQDRPSKGSEAKSPQPKETRQSSTDAKAQPKLLSSKKASSLSSSRADQKVETRRSRSGKPHLEDYKAILKDMPTYALNNAQIARTKDIPRPIGDPFELCGQTKRRPATPARKDMKKPLTGENAPGRSPLRKSPAKKPSGAQRVNSNGKLSGTNTGGKSRLPAKKTNLRGNSRQDSPRTKNEVSRLSTRSTKRKPISFSSDEYDLESPEKLFSDERDGRNDYQSPQRTRRGGKAASSSDEYNLDSPQRRPSNKRNVKNYETSESSDDESSDSESSDSESSDSESSDDGSSEPSPEPKKRATRTRWSLPPDVDKTADPSKKDSEPKTGVGSGSNSEQAERPTTGGKTIPKPILEKLLKAKPAAHPATRGKTVPQHVLPRKKAAGETVAGKKTGGKTVAGKTAAGKTIPRKTVPRKTVPRNTVPRNTGPRKTVPRKNAPRKSAAGKMVSQKTVGEKSLVQQNIPSRRVHAGGLRSDSGSGPVKPDSQLRTNAAEKSGHNEDEDENEKELDDASESGSEPQASSDSDSESEGGSEKSSDSEDSEQGIGQDYRKQRKELRKKCSKGLQEQRTEEYKTSVTNEFFVEMKYHLFLQRHLRTEARARHLLIDAMNDFAKNIAPLRMEGLTSLGCDLETANYRTWTKAFDLRRIALSRITNPEWTPNFESVLASMKGARGSGKKGVQINLSKEKYEFLIKNWELLNDVLDMQNRFGAELFRIQSEEGGCHLQ